MASRRWSLSLLLVQLLLSWSALTIDQTATAPNRGEENDHHRVFLRDQILYPTTAEDTSNAVDDQHVLRLLSTIYASSIRPAERQSHYINLGITRSTLTETTLLAKPFVLLLGPWSTGKTTTINYLLGDENNEQLPSGAEPTTSHFTVINYGKRVRQTDGILLAADPAHPLTELEQLGHHALEHVTELKLPHRLLTNVTLVDTPGMFENQAQRDRGYPYDAMLGWFADRADLIVIMFDPTHVEIGHEMTALFRQLKHRHAALRIVLNKADSIDEEQLMRVYGALLWSLSPLVNATEPPRVYLSSLWSRPHRGQPAFTRLLERDEGALLHDLRSTIQGRVRNKIAQVRQQAQRVRNHYILIDAFVAAYRRQRGSDDQINRRLLADIIANPTKYGILKAAMVGANGPFEEPDADEYSAYFKAISIDDHRTTDELCGTDSHCAFRKLQEAIDVQLPDLIRQYSARKQTEISSDEQTDRDNDDDDQVISSDAEKFADESHVNEHQTDNDESDATDDHMDQEKSVEIDEETSSETDVSHENKSENYWTSEEDVYAAQIPNDYVREPSGSFLFAEAAASVPKPVVHRKKKQKQKETENVEEVEADAHDEPEIHRKKKQKQKETKNVEEVEADAHDEPDIPRKKKQKQKETEKGGEVEADADDEPNKLKCRFRKSCYESGEAPKLRPNLFGDKIVVKAQPVEDNAEDEEDDDEEQKRKRLMFRCKWRKSCYESGEVPKLRPNIFVPVAVVQESGTKTQDSNVKATDDDEDDDEETSKLLIKQRCHYRRSCYDTGVVPDLTWKPPVPTQHVEPDIVYDPAQSLETRCRYRKSCYGTGKLPEDLKLKVTKTGRIKKDHHHHKKDKDGKNSESGDAVAGKKSTGRTKKHHKAHRTEQLTKARKRVEKRKEKHSANKVPELVKVETLPADVMKLQCRYRISCYRTGVIVENADTATDTEENDADISDSAASDEELSDSEIKLRCRYRKSCYGLYGLEVQLDEHEEVVVEHTPEMTEEAKKAKLQLYAKWILHELAEAEADAPEKPPALPQPVAEAFEKVQVKNDCRYRKSCYETGVVPKLVPQISLLPTFEIPSDETDEEEEDEVVDIKMQCRYRKSCYDTGILPDLSKKAAVVTQEVEEPEEVVINYYTSPQLRCRYRKSCYETGRLPDEFFTPEPEEEEESIGDRLFSEAIPTTIEDVKLFCRYRKSCYLRAAEAQLDPDEMPPILPPTSSPSAAVEQHDPSELKPCRPYQRKNCIKVEEDEPTESDTKSKAEEPVPEVTELKPCKPYQRKNCIKVEEDEPTESDTESKAEEPVPEVTELKPCKPYQRKNCIKIDDDADEEEKQAATVIEPEPEEQKLKPCKPYQHKNCIKVEAGESVETPPSKLRLTKPVHKEESSEEQDDNADEDESGEQKTMEAESGETEEQDETGVGSQPEDDDNSESTETATAESDEDKSDEDDKQEAEVEKPVVVVVPPPVVPKKSAKTAPEEKAPVTPKKSAKTVPEERPPAAPKKSAKAAPEERPIVKPAVTEFVKESVGYKEDSDEEFYRGVQRDENSKKLACKYKISCYRKAGIDFKKSEKDSLPASASHRDVAELLVSEEEADRMKAAILLGQLARDEATRRTKCHYRKSCYETGTPQVADADEKVVRNVLEELEDTEDEEENKLLIKLRCHYRKSCYDTGIIPELTAPEPVLLTNLELPLESGHPTVELKCKYRKSCYETGEVPKEFTAKTPEAADFARAPPAADFVPAIRPETLSDLKLLCRYRKSCYDRVSLFEDADKTSDEKETPSPPHPSTSRKEDRRGTTAPQAATGDGSTCSKSNPKACQQSPDQTVPTAGQKHPPTAVVAGRCHKYRLSCREQLGLPPKEKVPIGPNGKKLCRKKKPTVVAKSS